MSTDAPLMPPHRAGHVWLYFLAVAALAFGASFLVMLLTGRDTDPSVAWLLKCALVMVLVVSLTAFYMRRDRLHWSRYGVCAEPQVLLHCLGGFAGGLLLALGWAGVVAFWAPFHWQANPTMRADALVMGTLASFAIGMAEEVGYRSYGMERLRQDRGTASAVGLPTLIFAAAHVVGGMHWLPGLLVVASGGLLYACLMLATRSLPLVICFHVANNVGQDALLRTGEGSLWQPVFADPTQAQANSVPIWAGMCALNLLVAVCAWRYHARTLPDMPCSGGHQSQGFAAMAKGLDKQKEQKKKPAKTMKEKKAEKNAKKSAR